MKCPICNLTMLVGDRNGVEIDYCPQCRGVWLDHGELNKLTTGSAATETKWHAYFSQEDSLFNLKPRKHKPYHFGHFIHYWRAKANLLRRTQIDYRA